MTHNSTGRTGYDTNSGGSLTNSAARGCSIAIVTPLVLALPAALVSPLLALLLGAATLVVIVVGAWGLDGASVAVMTAAFALAPADILTLPGLAFLGVSDALFFVALALAVPRLLATRLPVSHSFVLGSLVFVPIILLASLQASDPADAYYYGARVIFVVIGLPLLLVWWAPRGRVLLALVVAYVVGTGVSVLIGIPDIGDYRNYGLTQHPNALGYTAVLSLSLVPFIWKAASPRTRWWLVSGTVAVAVVGILTSGSRAALVVAFVLLVLVPTVERSILLAIGVVLGGLVAVATLGSREASDSQDALSRLLGAGDVSGSDSERRAGVESTWETAAEHPLLGTGFSFEDFVAHNLYVEVAIAVGFIGLAAFLVIIGSMVMPIVFRRDLHSQLVYPAVVFVVAGPVSPNLTDRYIGLLLGLSLVGVVAARSARYVDGASSLSAALNR